VQLLDLASLRAGNGVRVKRADFRSRTTEPLARFSREERNMRASCCSLRCMPTALAHAGSLWGIDQATDRGLVRHLRECAHRRPGQCP